MAKMISAYRLYNSHTAPKLYSYDIYVHNITLLFSGKKETWDLMRVGVNPMDEEQLLGNFKAKNTKERAALPKKKV